MDVGGGAGHQSIPLARDGYDVTILDSSPTMLSRAAGRLAREPSAVAARVHLRDGRGEDSLALLGTARFAAVLCHGVLAYVDDPEVLINGLCGLATTGAIVSIMTKNASTLAVRPAIDRDWDAALSAFDADREVNRLGLESRGDTPHSLGARLERHDVTPIAWYGVRLFTEGWSRTEPPVDPTALVLEVERQASCRDPYRLLSRCFHLIGMRR